MSSKAGENNGLIRHHAESVPGLDNSHDICPHDFYQYDHRAMRHIFVVKQIPLILAYALTIHKSQGMTLPDVYLDCEGAFDPGQLAVAISRVRDIKDITIVNFRPGLCPPHPPIINGFYGSESTILEDCHSCCSMTYAEFSGDSDDEYACGDLQSVDRGVDEQLVEEEEEEDSEDDESDDCDLGAGGHGGDVEAAGVSVDDATCPEPSFPYECILDANMDYPSSLTSHELKNRLHIPDPFTDMQEAVNRIVSGVNDSDLKKWGKFLWYNIHLLYNRHCKKANDSKQSNMVIHEFINVFSQSEPFKRSVLATFKILEMDEVHLSIALSGILRVQDMFFLIKSQ